MDRVEHGRLLLARWEVAKPTNFYEDDEYLRAALRRRLDPEELARAEPVLRQAGADAAGPVSRAAMALDQPERLPRLERWSPVGERIEEVRFDPCTTRSGAWSGARGSSRCCASQGT